METNFYLIILIGLLVFFCVYIIYSNKNVDTFTNQETIKIPDKQVYNLDSRFDYPTVPPVNPTVYNSTVLNEISTDPDLFSNQEMVDGFILNQTNKSGNQLVYSGGTTELIKIPLQLNEPNNEPLRSQEILITPYNQIKYKSN